MAEMPVEKVLEVQGFSNDENNDIVYACRKLQEKKIML